MFKALLLENTDGFLASVAQVDESRLPPGDVSVAVAYSTLNYKDGLAITNQSPIVRNWRVSSARPSSVRLLLMPRLQTPLAKAFP